MNLKTFKALRPGATFTQYDHRGENLGTLRLVYNGLHFARIINEYGVETRLEFSRAFVRKLIEGFGFTPEAVSFDYHNQAWVKDGRYVRCGHPGDSCNCYGRIHEGEEAIHADHQR
jgi:hypothetical protein